MKAVRVCYRCHLPHSYTIKCKVYKKALATIDRASVLQLQAALKTMGKREGVQDVLPNPTSSGVDPVYPGSD